MEYAKTATDPRPERLAEIGGGMNNKAAVCEAHEKEWAIRRKPWAECSIEEKLEKLRMAERESQRSMGYVARTAGEAMNLAQQHQHSHNGEVLRPARDPRGGAECASGSMDILA